MSQLDHIPRRAAAAANNSASISASRTLRVLTPGPYRVVACINASPVIATPSTHATTAGSRTPGEHRREAHGRSTTGPFGNKTVVSFAGATTPPTDGSLRDEPHATTSVSVTTEQTKIAGCFDDIVVSAPWRSARSELAGMFGSVAFEAVEFQARAGQHVGQGQCQHGSQVVRSLQRAETCPDRNA